MRFPHVIPAHNLAHGWTERYCGDGLWTPARPMAHPGTWRYLFRRIQIAWRVFTGEYDALRWKDQ